MEFDIIQLLTVFDELLTPPTDEELGIYWLRATRKDGLILTLSLSVYENTAAILIWNSSNIAITHIKMKKCSEVKVLDEKKRQIEILHSNSENRCFISLDGDNILSYNE